MRTNKTVAPRILMRVVSALVCVYAADWTWTFVATRTRSAIVTETQVETRLLVIEDDTAG